MEERLGFIGVVMEERRSAALVNEAIGAFAHLVRARIGVPDAQSDSAVIGLIVQGSDRDLGALTARLGNIRGVQVKSALVKSKDKGEE